MFSAQPHSCPKECYGPPPAPQAAAARLDGVGPRSARDAVELVHLPRARAARVSERARARARVRRGGGGQAQATRTGGLGEQGPGLSTRGHRV
jgi:hypothetical protein